MEEILKIVTINYNNEDDEIVEIVLYQQFFLYRICDINLTNDKTGYVYMMISIRQYFCFILERKIKLLKY